MFSYNWFFTPTFIYTCTCIYLSPIFWQVSLIWPTKCSMPRIGKIHRYTLVIIWYPYDLKSTFNPYDWNQLLSLAVVDQTYMYFRSISVFEVKAVLSQSPWNLIVWWKSEWRHPVRGSVDILLICRIIYRKSRHVWTYACFYDFEKHTVWKKNLRVFVDCTMKKHLR